VTGPYCSFNGKLIPSVEAVVGVDDVDFAYGFGVYETLKVRNRVLYFPELHENRLFTSAAVIGLAHPFEDGAIVRWTRDLIRANRTENANIKIMLIGGDGAQGARLYIMALNPLYPERKDYKTGAAAIIYPGERLYPQAKTLNMLMSTLAFRAARAAGAYDAILRDRHGNLTEGTRTNLFFTDGTAVYTSPAETVLEGVTKFTIRDVLRETGIPLEERTLPEKDLPRYAGYFLSSTSTKIMPLRHVGDYESSVPELVRRLMKLYDEYLDRYAADQGPLF
jgi:branched-subunit amino acid aminotransferase/4-amino-4-deoxychorismate lyase